MSGHEKLHIAAARRNQRRRSMPVEGFAASNVVRLPSSITRLLDTSRGAQQLAPPDRNPDDAA